MLVLCFCTIIEFFVWTGSRHQTPDTVDERVRDLPPRQYGNPRPGARGGPLRRDNRRDERRRMTDDEEIVLDSQDVSSIDRGEWFKKKN